MFDFGFPRVISQTFSGEHDFPIKFYIQSTSQLFCGSRNLSWIENREKFVLRRKLFQNVFSYQLKSGFNGQ